MPLKKTHLPLACLRQAVMIGALDLRGSYSHSNRSRSSVSPKYASARGFLVRLAPGIFLTGIREFFG